MNEPSGWDRMKTEAGGPPSSSSSDALGASAPWMAKLLALVADKYGPLGLVILFVMGVWVGWIPSPITDSKALIQKVDLALTQYNKTQADELVRSRVADEKMILVFRMICARVSKNDAQTEECWGWKQ